MGADAGEPGRPEGPPHRVTISRSLALGRYEVTHAQFARFVRESGYRPAPGCRVWRGTWTNAMDAGWQDPAYGRPPHADDPVTCVSWRDASAYVAWLSRETARRYRLPSEAEWEYAARATTETPWYWGTDETQACANANTYDSVGAAQLHFDWAPVGCDDGHALVAPVGSYPPNAFGLHDMLGNVWEWTADCYVAPYPATPVDGSAIEVDGRCERRAVRGGSWITRITRNRVTFRGRDPEDARYSYFGFRVARDL
jgi:formylglycine-generating enzyme required for sulfatase activity